MHLGMGVESLSSHTESSALHFVGLCTLWTADRVRTLNSGP